jgi:hypothetical protein
MRIIGYLGILILLPFALLVIAMSLRNGDLLGMVLSLLMVVMLAAFAIVLWRGAKNERLAGRERLADGWFGQSVTSFFVAVVARTIEGRLFITSALVHLAVAVLSWLSPAVIGVPPDRGEVSAAVFGMWPLVAFALYVRICGPSFESSLLKSLGTVAVGLVPFYIVYF